jgi:hypothetical protein
VIRLRAEPVWSGTISDLVREAFSAHHPAVRLRRFFTWREDDLPDTPATRAMLRDLELKARRPEARQTIAQCAQPPCSGVNTLKDVVARLKIKDEEHADPDLQ